MNSFEYRPSEEDWVVAVPAGRWQGNGIRALKAAGFRVLGIDENPEAEGFDYCDASLVCQLDDLAGQLSFILDQGIRVRTAVSFCSDAGIVPAARLRSSLGCPGPTVAVAKTLTNKILQRRAFRDAGVPSTDFVVLASRDDLLVAEEQLPWPWVLKPSDAAGSRGVTVAGNPEEAAIAYVDAMSESREGLAIAECYVRGVEHTVELIGHQGEWTTLAVTEKTKRPQSQTVSDSLSTIDLSSEKAERLVECAVQAVEAIGLMEGIVHAELIWNELRGPVMIELAGRGGGFMLDERFVPRVSGISPVNALIDMFRGIPQPPRKSLNLPGTLAFLPSERGRVRRVEIGPRALSNPDVEVGVLIADGHSTQGLRGDGERVAYAIALGPQFGTTELSARSVLAELRVDYER